MNIVAEEKQTAKGVAEAHTNARELTKGMRVLDSDVLTDKLVRAAEQTEKAFYEGIDSLREKLTLEGRTLTCWVSRDEVAEVMDQLREGTARLGERDRLLFMALDHYFYNGAWSVDQKAQDGDWEHGIEYLPFQNEVAK